MERWTIGVNDVYKFAIIHREVGGWWLFAIERMILWPYGFFKIFGAHDWYGLEVHDRLYQWVWKRYTITNLKVDLDDAIPFLDYEVEGGATEHVTLEDLRQQQKNMWSSRNSLVGHINKSRHLGIVG